MLFTNSAVVKNTDIDLYINNCNPDEEDEDLKIKIDRIPDTESFKFLGINFDSKLNFKSHLQILSKNFLVQSFSYVTQKIFSTKKPSLQFTMLYFIPTFNIWHTSLE